MWYADEWTLSSLATSELYFTIALLWRRLNLDIYDTVEEKDVMTTNDCFIGMTDLKSEGIKVKIIGEINEWLGRISIGVCT
jgi:hypothetical protein